MDSKYEFLVGRVLVSRTGDVGWTVSWWERCPNICLADTTKGVGSLRQQDGGHGSRNPLRSV